MKCISESDKSNLFNLLYITVLSYDKIITHNTILQMNYAHFCYLLIRPTQEITFALT